MRFLYRKNYLCVDLNSEKIALDIIVYMSLVYGPVSWVLKRNKKISMATMC